MPRSRRNALRACGLRRRSRAGGECRFIGPAYVTGHETTRILENCRILDIFFPAEVPRLSFSAQGVCGVCARSAMQSISRGYAARRVRAQRNAMQSIFAGSPTLDERLELFGPGGVPLLMIILSFGCVSFGRPKVPDQIRCNSLHDHASFHATNYPLAGSAFPECVAFIAFIAHRADSLHVGCVRNAMQRNASLRVTTSHDQANPRVCPPARVTIR